MLKAYADAGEEIPVGAVRRATTIRDLQALDGDLMFWYFEDMLYYDGVFYGDWSVHSLAEVLENRPGETPLYPDLAKMKWPDRFVPGSNYRMSDQELTTTLAALRHWQFHADKNDISENYAEHFNDIKPLNMEAIDRLCERLNTGESSRPVLKEYEVSVVKTVTSSVDCSIKAASAEEAERQALKTHGLVVTDDPNTQVNVIATEVAT
jgi:hypothetical protein